MLGWILLALYVAPLLYRLWGLQDPASREMTWAVMCAHPVYGKLYREDMKDESRPRVITLIMLANALMWPFGFGSSLFERFVQPRLDGKPRTYIGHTNCTLLSPHPFDQQLEGRGMPIYVAHKEVGPPGRRVHTAFAWGPPQVGTVLTAASPCPQTAMAYLLHHVRSMGWRPLFPQGRLDPEHDDDCCKEFGETTMLPDEEWSAWVNEAMEHEQALASAFSR